MDQQGIPVTLTGQAPPEGQLPIPEDDTKGKAPSDKQLEKSAAALSKLDQAVVDAQKAADDAKLSKEELALRDAKAKADDARSQHWDLTGAADAANAKPMTVFEAKVVAVVDPSVSAGDNRAQKFGNDPANPALAPGIDPAANHVKLSRKTPDLPGDGMAYTSVPKEMVGDYERAGWNRS